VGKSFIVHINAACNLKVFLYETSNESTPTSHSMVNLLINGCKHTSILLFRLFRPKIIQLKSMYGVIICISRGKLQGATTIDHTEYDIPHSENSVKPLAHKPHLTFFKICCEIVYFWSKYFQASPFDGCRRTPDSCWCSCCHLIRQQIFLTHTIFTISGLKEGTAFSHMKPPYVPLDWSSVMFVLLIYKICMQTDFHHVYNKACTIRTTINFLNIHA